MKRWREEITRRKEEAFDTAVGMMLTVGLTLFLALVVLGIVGLIWGISS